MVDGRDFLLVSFHIQYLMKCIQCSDFYHIDSKLKVEKQKNNSIL